MEDDEEEKPFAVEMAKTGRAKCKKCKCPIDKDTVRVAKLMSNPFSEGKMKAWHHVDCLFEVFAKQRATTKRIEDPEEDVSGWAELDDASKAIILEKLEQFEENAPFKNPNAKTPKKQATARKASPGDTPVTKQSFSSKKGASSSGEKNSVSKKSADDASSTLSAPSAGKSTKDNDNSFREFRRLCAEVAGADAYTEKTAIVRNMLTKGSSGSGFRGDGVLWCKLLLPGVRQRVYNLQSKQLIKLFARLLCQDEDDMLEDLEQGDVAETVRIFFESSSSVTPAKKSALTIHEVEQFLEHLSMLTKEDEQIQHFRSIAGRCTGNDLKMIVRLIKHDLRINAGPKHILAAVHEDAYRSFQMSRDLDTVLRRFLAVSPSEDSKRKLSVTSPSSTVAVQGGKVTLSLMTPVLPMLAEACKSVEMAMKKCPHGMLSEVKYDGERVQVHKRGDEFRYFSRSLKPVMAHKVKLFKEYITKSFPGGDDLILDSEILMVDNNTGKPLPFGSLGVHKKAEFKDANVCLFVFDCIYYNGEILLDKPMKVRRNILKERMTEIPNRIMLSEVQEVHRSRDLAEMIAKVLRMGLEGLVLKDVNGTYEPGKRHWLKVKKDYLFDGAMADSADLVVLGAWYGTGAKGGIMSIFLMGCYDEDRDVWLTVTKVHTGHDDATLAALQDELDMVKISKDPSKVPRWLRANKPMIPDFVARDPKRQPVWEITGAEFTNQGVHTAEGISIRFPRVTQIRQDKDWTSATSLKELRALFEKSSESTDFSLLLKTEKSESGVSGSKMVGKGVANNDGVQTLEKFLKREAVSESSLLSGGEEKVRIKREPCSSPEKDVDDEKPSTSSHSAAQTAKRRRVEKHGLDKAVKIEPDAKIKVEPRSFGEPGFSKCDPNVGIKVEKECLESGTSDLAQYEEEARGEFYSFVERDYIEYSAAGSPLNWFEGRKPPKGLPSDAKPLSFRTEEELKSKCILRGVRAYLSPNFKRSSRKAVRRTLRTLGAAILSEWERQTSTHVIHPVAEVSSARLQGLYDVPKTARHVNVSWLEKCAAESEMEDVYEHAVELIGDYCECSCSRGT